MKLITHNMLTSNILKGVKNGFPLLIEAKEVKVTPIDFNADFISRMIPRLQWKALHQAFSQVASASGTGVDLPAEIPESFESNEEFLKKSHHALLEIEIVEGDMLCPETGRKFPIQKGIPNMLLKEDEV